jgi:hypothetical protein
MFEKASVIQLTTLGPEQHGSVGDTKCQMAAVAAKQGKFKQAFLLYAESLHIYEGAYGRDHPKTVEVRTVVKILSSVVK